MLKILSFSMEFAYVILMPGSATSVLRFFKPMVAETYVTVSPNNPQRERSYVGKSSIFQAKAQ